MCDNTPQFNTYTKFGVSNLDFLGNFVQIRPFHSDLNFT